MGKILFFKTDILDLKILIEQSNMYSLLKFLTVVLRLEVFFFVAFRNKI